LVLSTMPVKMERRRTNKRTKTKTKTAARTKNFRNHHSFYHILGLYICLFPSSRIYTAHSSSAGSTNTATATATTTRTVHQQRPPLENLRNRLHSASLILQQQHQKCDTATSLGFYYGISRGLIESYVTNKRASTKKRGNSNEDSVAAARRRYLERYENIGIDVEKWAERIMHDHYHSSNDVNNLVANVENTDDWTEIFCAKTLRSKFNNENSSNNDDNNNLPLTRQWVKWMKDSREINADLNDQQKHPCMKLIGTIDAPFPIVCRYLSAKDRFRKYNSLLVDQKDIEVLTPHSKICWSQSKKLLFIQPRDFVTYCRHRWLKDGTQLITNQACDHPLTKQHQSDSNTNTTTTTTLSSDSTQSEYRAFSLRGATYISRCPDFPGKRTKIVMLSHCNCGQDIPEWAVRTAVGVMAPIKPFEIIHRINVGIQQTRQELEAEMKSKTGGPMTTTTTKKKKKKVAFKPRRKKIAFNPRRKKIASDPGRSSQPAGFAQMGYACFWPEGGGLVGGLNE